MTASVTPATQIVAGIMGKRESGLGTKTSWRPLLQPHAFAGRGVRSAFPANRAIGSSGIDMLATRRAGARVDLIRAVAGGRR
jgi:hypothetical protein